MRPGAFSVVEKPFSDELLIERVREAIASRRTCRPAAPARVVAAREVVIESAWLDQVSRVSTIVPVLSAYGDLYVRVGIPVATAQTAAATVVRHNVLLRVDDEPSIQPALRRILRREGYTLLFAGSAAEALELLSRHSVGVVISDLRMPGMDGIQFLDRVRSLHPQAVRMILSGYADVGMITSAINRGAVFRFLHKPWDDRELLEAVRARSSCR